MKGFWIITIVLCSILIAPTILVAILVKGIAVLGLMVVLARVTGYTITLNGGRDETGNEI